MSDWELAQNLYMRVIESLQLVAADYDTQTSVLPEWVHIPDEIALKFDDALQYARQIVPLHFLTAEVVERMQEIESVWTRRSRGNSEFAPEFWTLDAMQDDPEWEQVRQIARAVLALLHVPLRRPDLAGITYILSK